MGWEKEPQPTILFLCDVNVAADGHVDFKSTYYYSQDKEDVEFLNVIRILYCYCNKRAFIGCERNF